MHIISFTLWLWILERTETKYRTPCSITIKSCSLLIISAILAHLLILQKWLIMSMIDTFVVKGIVKNRKVMQTLILKLNLISLICTPNYSFTEQRAEYNQTLWSLKQHKQFIIERSASQWPFFSWNFNETQVGVFILAENRIKIRNRKTVLVYCIDTENRHVYLQKDNLYYLRLIPWNHDVMEKWSWQC